MIRLSTIVWILVVAVSAFGLYSVKFKVQTLRAQIADIERQIETERESMNVVAAEWAYLNRPERIERLAAAHLNAQEVTVERIADVQAIPLARTLEASIQQPAPPASPAINASLAPSAGEMGDHE